MFVKSQQAHHQKSNVNNGSNFGLWKEIKSTVKNRPIAVVFTVVTVSTILILTVYKDPNIAQLTDNLAIEEISNDVSRSLATGNNYLYDLTSDPREATDLYSNSAYSLKASSLLVNATSWISRYNPPNVPDSTGQKIAYNAAGGLVPWVSDTTSPRVIQQKYYHPGAPHIIFLLVDDWGWNDVGYQSTYMNWTTPNIDKLAASGIKLTNYYSHELCGPSRAALLTGRYASRFGFHGDTVNIIELPLTEVTIAEEMKSAGYRTNLIGKWHMGYSTWSKTPTYRGFDYFYGFYSGFIDYWTKVGSSYLDLHENKNLVTSAYELSTSTHSSYLLQQKAQAVIADHALNYADQPMFMYYASQLIHDPFQAPQKYIDRCHDSTSTSTQETYCALNLMLDEVVGNLTCALEANGMLDNTLFVMVSDNGGLSGLSGNSFPFLGAKGSMYRGGISAGGFVFGSENLIPVALQGTSYSGLVHVTDWLPTLMGVATNKAWTGSYIGSKLDGVDVFDAILGVSGAKTRREILHYLDFNNTIAYQYDNMKIMVNTKKSSMRYPLHYFARPNPAAGPAQETCDYFDALAVSSKPTFIPTGAPSLTYTPTVLTVAPSFAPTKKPQTVTTLTPSANPSVVGDSSSPSTAPVSVSPTVSYAPTKKPQVTTSPSGPTASPTALPSLSTIIPTAVPSVCPSFIPSNVPTIKPTCTPTVTPTLQPSVKPSATPSTVPTMTPSRVPSVTPSAVLSQLPSVTPNAVSSIPSAVPSQVEPSVSPSSSPSKLPSIAPSETPSVAPSEAPTVFPSVLPTVEPSDTPSASPSVISTTSITGYVSELPTSDHAYASTTTPTQSPSEIATEHPTILPTEVPSTFRPTLVYSRIHWDCTLYMQEVRQSPLPSNAQQAIRDSCAMSMGVPSSSVKFKSQTLIGDSIRSGRRVTNGLFQVEVVLTTEVSTEDYASTISDDPAELYAVLKERIINAVVTNTFQNTLRTMSMSYNATSTIDVGDVLITVAAYSTSDSVSDIDDNKSTTLSGPAIAGIVMAFVIIVCIAIAVVCRRQHRKTAQEQSNMMHPDEVRRKYPYTEASTGCDVSLPAEQQQQQVQDGDNIVMEEESKEYDFSLKKTYNHDPNFEGSPLATNHIVRGTFRM